MAPVPTIDDASLASARMRRRQDPTSPSWATARLARCWPTCWARPACPVAVYEARHGDLSAAARRAFRRRGDAHLPVGRAGRAHRRGDAAVVAGHALRQRRGPDADGPPRHRRPGPAGLAEQLVLPSAGARADPARGRRRAFPTCESISATRSPTWPSSTPASSSAATARARWCAAPSAAGTHDLGLHQPWLVVDLLCNPAVAAREGAARLHRPALRSGAADDGSQCRRRAPALGDHADAGRRSGAAHRARRSSGR